jgi:hypothetical protein
MTMAHLKMEGHRFVQRTRKRKSRKMEDLTFHERKCCCDVSTKHCSIGPRGGIAAVLGLGMCRPLCSCAPIESSRQGQLRSLTMKLDTRTTTTKSILYATALVHCWRVTATGRPEIAASVPRLPRLRVRRSRYYS